MRFEDIIDLKAYLDTLPAVANAVPETALAFPFSFRRGLGLWQLLYVDGETFVPDPAATDAVNRGAYLVEGAGHCTQCHSPRTFYGGIIADREYSGAPLAAGEGSAPNITTDNDDRHRHLVGRRDRRPVQDRLPARLRRGRRRHGPGPAQPRKLTAEDQNAMAEFMKTLPAIPSEYKATQAGGD